jgi:hypothetical protein
MEQPGVGKFFSVSSRALFSSVVLMALATPQMMAKLVSGLHKPDDQTLLLPPHASQFVATLPVRAIPGIGHKTNATLKSKFGRCNNSALISSGLSPWAEDDSLVGVVLAFH